MSQGKRGWEVEYFGGDNILRAVSDMGYIVMDMRKHMCTGSLKVRGIRMVWVKVYPFIKNGQVVDIWNARWQYQVKSHKTCVF